MFKFIFIHSMNVYILTFRIIVYTKMRGKDFLLMCMCVCVCLFVQCVYLMYNLSKWKLIHNHLLFKMKFRNLSYTRSLIFHNRIKSYIRLYILMWKDYTNYGFFSGIFSSSFYSIICISIRLCSPHRDSV